MFSYFTTPAPPPNFGSLAWTFLVAQLLGVAAGAYLYWMHSERNAARQTFTRMLGIVLLILGGVGIVLGALRLLNVPVMNQRLWFYIQLIVELGIAGYLVYYVRSVLPGLERSAAGRARSSNSRPGGSRPGSRSIATAEPAPATPRPVATTGRRDSRRDRKRKSK